MTILNFVSRDQNDQGNYTLEPMPEVLDNVFDASDEEKVRERMGMVCVFLEAVQGVTFINHYEAPPRLPGSNMLEPKVLPPDSVIAENVVDIRDAIELPDGIDPESCRYFVIYLDTQEEQEDHKGASVIWVVLRPQLPSEVRVKDRIEIASASEDDGYLCEQLFSALLDHDGDGQRNAEIIAAESTPGLMIHFPSDFLGPAEWAVILREIPFFAEILEDAENEMATAMEILISLSKSRHNSFRRFAPDVSGLWDAEFHLDEGFGKTGLAYFHVAFREVGIIDKCKYKELREGEGLIPDILPHK